MHDPSPMSRRIEASGVRDPSTSWRSWGLLVTPAVLTLLLALVLEPTGGSASNGVEQSALSSTSQDAICPSSDPALDRYRYLRTLSLDLRGDVPSVEEYGLLDQAADVPASTLDAWLADEAFVDRVLRFHESLLWPNVSNVRLLSSVMRLSTASGNLLYRIDVAQRLRGQRVACLDKPATFTSSGNIVTETLADGSTREGYVLVAPYWDPSTQVKVCAFDAQTHVQGTTGLTCGTEAAKYDSACGCGDALRFCGRTTEEKAMLDALSEDVRRRVGDVIREDRSYLELFTGKSMYVNGPVVHYFKHQSQAYGDVRMQPLPIRLEVLPDLAFTDKETWVEIPLHEHHAGVLTSPAYLLRFMTNRSRANHFFSTFLCQPFIPPEGGIPLTAPPILDLQEREGCDGCHVLLEPSASFWGRWSESGAAWLAPDRFPPVRNDCMTCATQGGCSDECNRYYVSKALTSEELPWMGSLRWYEFRHEEHEIHVEEGPSMLANLAVVDERLPHCTAQTAFQWLMGRPPADSEAALITSLSREFQQSNFNYRQLVRSIVTSTGYRRVQ